MTRGVHRLRDPSPFNGTKDPKLHVPLGPGVQPAGLSVTRLSGITAPECQLERKLKISSRYSSCCSSLRVNVFLNEISAFLWPGARSMSRPEFPNLPGRGAANAAGLNH